MAGRVFGFCDDLVREPLATPGDAKQSGMKQGQANMPCFSRARGQAVVDNGRFLRAKPSPRPRSERDVIDHIAAINQRGAIEVDSVQESKRHLLSSTAGTRRPFVKVA